jgi:hypothetical protein
VRPSVCQTNERQDASLRAAVIAVTAERNVAAFMKRTPGRCVAAAAAAAIATAVTMD